MLRILREFGFSAVSIRGSHAKLKREAEGSPTHVLTVPLHRELAPGTVQAIYRPTARLVPEQDLHPHFNGTD
ncbi:MAG TPA: type II toxin-antitoxin system HicA family toxin [Candidatus Aminicenantes bacterium]|nr:type II toxin-antitoxin system HicA family toxin [Candidatus Aminicenantes bacterium]